MALTGRACPLFAVQEIQSLMFELSMWRASDELQAYAVRMRETRPAGRCPDYP